MATTGARRVFVDTNVLVYANVVSAPHHDQARQAITSRERLGDQVWVSRQVVREYLATLTRAQSFAAPVSATVLAAQVRLFVARFRVAEDSATVTDHLLTLLEHYPVAGRQVHDANIVATMLTYGIRHLLTHNVADFTRFAPIITVLPLDAG